MSDEPRIHIEKPWGEGSLFASVTMRKKSEYDFKSFALAMWELTNALDKEVKKDPLIDPEDMNWGYVTGAPIQDIWIQTRKKEDE